MRRVGTREAVGRSTRNVRTRGTGSRRPKPTPRRLRAGLPPQQAPAAPPSRWTIGADGRFGLPAGARTERAELDVIAEALAESPQAQPLGKVSQVTLLDKVAARAQALFEGALPKALPPGRQAVTLRGDRAVSLQLLLAAAVRANALGDAARAAKYLDVLLEELTSEPCLPLRDFVVNRVDRLLAQKQLPAGTRGFGRALAQMYPREPDYARMLADGKVKLLLYLDNDSATYQTTVHLLREWGFATTKNAAGQVVARREGDPGDVPMEIELQPLPQTFNERASQPIFSRLSEPDVDGAIYSGHCYYSYMGHQAAERANGADTAGKLMILSSCDGDALIEPVRRLHPRLQVVGTREVSESYTEDPFVRSLLRGLQKKQPWKTLQEHAEAAAVAGARKVEGYEDFDPRAHYYFPHQRRVHQRREDLDGDGVSDDLDPLFHVTQAPPRPAGLSSYEPAPGTVDARGLDGRALTWSSSLLNEVQREYDIPETVADPLRWGPEVFVPGGFYEPDAGDQRVCQLRRLPDQRIEVQVSTRYAHASMPALSRMMAYETGLWLGQQAGFDDATRAALGLSMLARTLYQYCGTQWSDLAESESTHQARFRARYGLDIDFTALLAVTEQRDYFVTRDWKRLTRWLADHPAALAHLVARFPKAR